MYRLDITTGSRPTEKLLNLEATISAAELIITDTSGKEIVKQSFSGKWQMNLGSLAKGAYFIQLTKEDKLVMRIRFVKH